MLRNDKEKYHIERNFESYKKLQNKSTKACKCKRKIYFQERCEGGIKNKHIWKTIKPYLSNKSSQNDNITLREDNPVISDSKQGANVHFVNIAKYIASTTLFPHALQWHHNERLLNCLFRRR